MVSNPPPVLVGKVLGFEVEPLERAFRVNLHASGVMDRLNADSVRREFSRVEADYAASPRGAFGLGDEVTLTELRCCSEFVFHRRKSTPPGIDLLAGV